jgi:hypothetical protein
MARRQPTSGDAGRKPQKGRKNVKRTGIKLLVAAIGAASALSVATPAMAVSCPNGDACFWTKIGLKGDLHTANPDNWTQDQYYDITNWYPYMTKLGSFHNKWSSRIFISTGKPGAVNLCFPPGGTGSPDRFLEYVYFGKSTKC